MNKNSRTTNVFLNIIGGAGGKIFSSLLSMACRTYFISLLGATYLGVNGLFANILQMLSLAELGIGPAIVFSMYKPIVDNDEEHIARLMNFYKSAYRLVAVIVSVIGVCLLPFLDFFIKDTNGIENIRFIFILILSNTVISYFYAYKGAMLNADQKSYVVEIIRNLFEAIRCVAQIFVLIYTHNFIFYLVTQIITTFLGNYIQAKYVDRKYPFLVKHKSLRVDNEERQGIFKRVRGMMMHKFGGFVINGTDSLVISKFVGVITVGVYSNYLLIINLIKGYVYVFSKALSASVGNLIASGNNEHSHDVFKTTVFVHFWIYALCMTAFWTIFQPFITLWIGDEFLLPSSVLFVVLLNFYFMGYQETVNTFTNATGLFWETRYKPLLECVIKIGVSILLAAKWGILGVFLGTMASYFVSFWINPVVLYRKHFNGSVAGYFVRFIMHALLAIATALGTNILCNLIGVLNLIVDVALRVIVCAIVPNLVFTLIFFRTKEFKYCLNVVKNILNKRRGK